MKEIIIKINEQDRVELLTNQYRLCMAGRDRDYEYHVIGFAEVDYYEQNLIHLEDLYQVFYCVNIKDRGILFPPMTPRAISPGQQIEISKMGELSSPTQSQEAKDEIHIINNYISVYPGIKRSFSLNNGTSQYIPTFIAPYAALVGRYSIKMLECVQIWFEQKAESGMVILNNTRQIVGAGKTLAVEINFSELQTQQAIVTYHNKNWIKK